MGTHSPAPRLLRALLFLLSAAAATVMGGAGCGTPAAVSSAAPGIAPAQSAAATPDRQHIVAVYQSHCGACHRPVAPGTEPSDRLQAELRIHRQRARLTDQEWAGLGAFLVARP